MANVRKKLLTLVTLLFCVAGCARPEPTLVVVVGGLGLSQLGDLRQAVVHQCPQATVVSAGGWDAYKSDVKAMATAKPHQHIILVGHSFGCQTIDEAAAKLPKVDLAVFIDPAWDDFRLSKNISHYLWYQRSGFGIEREARIVGAVTTGTIQGDHNGIPHSPELIADVVAAINGTISRPNVKPPTDHSRKPALATAH